jgi:hypothetical protein
MHLYDEMNLLHGISYEYRTYGVYEPDVNLK